MVDLSKTNSSNSGPMDSLTLNNTWSIKLEDVSLKSGIANFKFGFETRPTDINFSKINTSFDTGPFAAKASITVDKGHVTGEVAGGFGKQFDTGFKNLTAGGFVGIGLNTNGQVFSQLQGNANLFGAKVTADVKAGVELDFDIETKNPVSSLPNRFEIPAVAAFGRAGTYGPNVDNFVIATATLKPFVTTSFDYLKPANLFDPNQLKIEHNPHAKIDPNPYSVSDATTLNQYTTGYYGPNSGYDKPITTPTPLTGPITVPAIPVQAALPESLGAITPSSSPRPTSPVGAPTPPKPSVPSTPSRPETSPTTRPTKPDRSLGNGDGGGGGNGGPTRGGAGSEGVGSSGGYGGGSTAGGSKAGGSKAEGHGGNSGAGSGGGKSGGGKKSGGGYGMGDGKATKGNGLGGKSTFGDGMGDNSDGGGLKMDITRDADDYRPVLLDLAGNGLNVNSLSSSTQFLDLHGDGYMHRTAWAGKGTGVLVIDTNNDGKINQSNEFVFTEWDKSASGDLEAIRNIFDSNHNGKLDAGDARWSEFKVMIDGEMKTLDQLGIASIDLTPKGSGQNFADGSSITGTSQFTRTDGTTGTVGDAVLVSESDGYKLERTKVTNGDGSITETIKGYDADGRYAFTNIVTTSANGLNKTTSYDDDGTGVIDRWQTDSVSMGSDGTRTRTITNIRLDGSVADRTTIITSADKKTVTTNLDQDGDGKADQSETFTTNADGSTTTITKAFSVDGTLVKQVSVTAAANGLSKTTKTDINGDDVYELVNSEATVVNSDGSRTKTVDAKNGDGSLIAKTVTITSADNRNKMVQYDHTGNGTFDETETIITTVDSSGNVTTTTTSYNANNSLRDKTISTISASGLSRTTSTDLTGDGVADRIMTDVTVVAADNGRVQTVEQKSADGTLLSRTVTSTSGDGKTILIEEDQNGDGAVDLKTKILVNTDGTTSQILETFSPNGTLVSKTLTETLANMIGKKVSADFNGDGVYDEITTDGIYIYADQTRHHAISQQGNNGTLKGKVATGYSIDGLTETTDKWIDGDSLIDETVRQVTVLNGDGSRTQTITRTSGDGILLSREVAIVSTDRKTTTITTDANGDGATDRTIVQVTNANGSTTTTTSLTSGNGTLYDRSVATISADGLTKSLTEDLNGDGVIDRITTDTIVLNANGSRTQTIAVNNGDGSLVSKTIVTVSANGLVKTTSQDIDGNGTIDSAVTETSVINADGSATTTSQQRAGSVNTTKTITTVSANGLVSNTQTDIDGNGTIDTVATTTKVLNANGSSVVTSNLKSSSGVLLALSTTTTSADGKSVLTELDGNGDGAVDTRKSVSLNADGSRTEITSLLNTDGSLVSKTTVEVSADGLSKKTAYDYNGDGVVDKTTTDITVLNTDGGKTNTVISKGNNGAIIEKVVTTLSADELTRTVEEDLTGDGVADRITATNITINANGSRQQTETTKSGNGALLVKVVTLISGDGKTKTVTSDNNGDGKVDETSVSVLNADGSTTTTISSTTANGTVYAKTAMIVSADGLTVTTLKDLDGDGINDRTIVDKTVINADGSRTQTVTTTSGNGTLLDKATVNVSANGLIKTSEFDTNGDSVRDAAQVDQITLTTTGKVRQENQGAKYGTSQGALTSQGQTVISANGLTKTVQFDYDGNGTFDRIVETAKALKTDGSSSETISTTGWNGVLLAKTVTTTSANGKNVAIDEDLDGDGIVDRRTSIVVSANGLVTRTVSELKADGTVNSKAVTETSANGLSTTVRSDPDGNGTFDRTTSDVTALNTDGSRTRTISEFGANNVLTGKTVVTTNATGLTRVTTWSDGSGTILRSLSETTTINADGSTIQVQAYNKANGTLESKTTTTLSADALTKTVTVDLNGDGLVDQRLVTAEIADGSIIETRTDYGANGTTVIGKKTTTISPNGLGQTEDYDTDGNGTIDTRTNRSIVLNANGSKTETISTSVLGANGLALKEKTVVDISADGLSKTTKWDLAGSGTFGTSSTDVTVINPDATRTRTVSFVSGTNLTSRYVMLASANGYSVTTKWDTTGSGVFDQISTDVTTFNNDGTQTRTINNTRADGSLIAKTVTTKSADGLTVTTLEEREGQPARTIGNSSKVLADGSVINVATTLNASGQLLDRSVTNTSLDQRRVKIVRDANGDGNTDQTEERVQTVDGSITTTITGLRIDGTIANKTTEKTSADGLTTTTEFDTDGDGITNLKRVVIKSFNADGSQRSVATDTDDTGKLVSKITVNLSADGARRTIVKDVNGNGIIDQTETVAVDASGASMTTVVNNAEARDVSNLVSGSIYWTRAIAAKIETTTSADGLTTIVRSDYDGNGTYEHVTVSKALIDGSIRSTITETNTDGSVKAKGSMITSSDGLISVLNKDGNNDGIHEHIETAVRRRDGSVTLTSVDKNADGSLKQTTVESITPSGKLLHSLVTDGQGRKTAESLLGNDGTTTITTYDATSGQVLSIAKTSKKGVLATASLFDPLNAKDWIRIDQVFNAEGKKVTEVEYKDDGTRVDIAIDPVLNKETLVYRYDANGKLVSTITYDAANTQNWGRVERTYNAAGQITYESIFNDDNTRISTTYDRNASQPWLSVRQDFNAAGALVTQNNFNDDGTRVLFTFDPTNAASWSRVEETFNQASQLQFKTVLNDDGTRTLHTFDVTGNQTWKSILQTFNTSSQVVTQTNYNDEGTRILITFDPLNSAAWSRVEATYNQAGQWTYNIQFNDNGSRTVSSMDVTNAQTWSKLTQDFNAANQLIAQYQINDNGSRFDLKLDPANAAYWTRLEYHYNSANQLYYHVEFNDNGTKVIDNYDVGNGQVWSHFRQSFNASGQIVAQYQDMDDGTRYDIAFDPVNIVPWHSLEYWYNASQQLTREKAVMDDASRIETRYDVPNSQTWAKIVDGFNPYGQRTETNQYNDDGTRVQMFYNDQGQVRDTRYYNAQGQWTFPPGTLGRPVLLDMNADNHIDLRPFNAAEFANNAGPRFDWDADGVGDGTAWIGPQDGVLAIDLGENSQGGADGLIDQATELAFSMWATPEELEVNGGSVSDLEGLGLAFDTNHDAILDHNDLRWNEFRVWQDANQNGTTDQGELKTMSEAGIKLVNLIPLPQGAVQFSDGSAITGTSSYEMTDGSTRLVADATLAFRSTTIPA